MANTRPQIAVSELTIVSRTKNSISIRWTKATDKETPQSKLQYTVTWCVAPYKWDNNVRHIGEKRLDNSSYVITGLTPNTTYDIIVYVRDEHGAENAYAKTTVATLPDTDVDNPPTIPNKNLTVTAINARSITISWQKATDKETAQSQLRYYVRWSVAPFTLANARNSGWKTNINSYSITGLIPDTSYAIQVWVADIKSAVCYTTRTVRTAKDASTSAPTNDEQRRKQIRDGLAGITYSPAVLVNDDLYKDTKVYPRAIENKVEKAAYLLSVVPTEKTNQRICVRGSGLDDIYPGSILLVDSAITTGDPNPLGGIERSTLTLYGDFLAGSTTKQTNVQPTNMGTRSAANEIMRILLRDPSYKAPGKQNPHTTIYTSKKEMMLDFKVDASFGGVNMNVNAKTDSSEQSFVQATTLEQEYFTVKLEDSWKQDPSKLFANNVTWDMIRQKIGGKALAVVTSVTYGRTFSYLKEFSAKKFTYTGSQKVKGYGQSAESEQSLAESQEYTNDDIFNMGGTALTISALRSKRTQADLEKAMADNMEFSESNQGVVTRYTLQLLTGLNPGATITPQYNVKYNTIGYVRCPNSLEAYINVGPVRIGAGDVKVQIDANIFRVVNDNAQIVRVVNGSSSKKAQSPWWYRFNHSRGRVYGDMGNGEYIYPNPLLRIRSHDSSVDSYRADDEKHIDVSSGKIKINLKGSVFAGQSVKIVSVEDNSNG